MKKSWVLSYPLSAQRRLWSDWADAQADLSLRWAHTHFVGFVMLQLTCICFHFGPYVVITNIMYLTTVKILKFRTPKQFAVITLNVWTRWLFLRVMHPKDADGIENSVDPDQRSSLIWVCTVCSDLFARKLRNITVFFYSENANLVPRQQLHFLLLDNITSNMHLYMSRDMTKPTKWLCTQPRLRSAWASSQSDQSLRCCALWVAKDPRFLHADSEDSDQTGRMPRLIWVFAGRTVTLLVLSCRGSYILDQQAPTQHHV